MDQWVRPILQNLGFQVYDNRTPIDRDIQPTIDIINSNHITIRVKHIDVTIYYFHRKCVLLAINNTKIKPIINL